MSNDVDFFAINADDVPRARNFYQSVFGWGFEPWGPPGFYLIATARNAEGGHSGALQERRELVPGHKMTGFECTIGVENIDQTIRAIEANGGRLATPKFHIPTVGTVAYFLDTTFNVPTYAEAYKYAAYDGLGGLESPR